MKGNTLLRRVGSVGYTFITPDMRSDQELLALFTAAEVKKATRPLEEKVAMLVDRIDRYKFDGSEFATQAALGDALENISRRLDAMEGHTLYGLLRRLYRRIFHV